MPMVEIKWPEDKGSYWIDAYEVKGGEYGVFEQRVQSGYVPPVTDEACQTNETYTRDPSCVHSASATDAEIAAVGVYCADYCDAQAYCEWVGKRLCKLTLVAQQDGGIGAGEDEWGNACSNGGKSPNSSDLPQDQCGVYDPPCADVVPGLFGMEWGFAEWIALEDSTGKINPKTSTVHGCVGSTPKDPSAVCSEMSGFSKDSKPHHTSFRCCR